MCAQVSGFRADGFRVLLCNLTRTCSCSTCSILILESGSKTSSGLPTSMISHASSSPHNGADPHRLLVGPCLVVSSDGGLRSINDAPAR